MKTLFFRPLYHTALDGLPGLGTPAEMAGRYLVGPGTLRERAEEMAQVYLGLSASTGFVCGLGGWITLPVTLPANVLGVALLQLHLCASTAFLASRDPRDPAVRTQCFDCLTGAIQGGEERDEAQEVVDRSAVKVAERGLRTLAEATVGLASRAGEGAARRFVTRRLTRRSLPFIGGVLGASSDFYATRRVAEASRDAFLSGPAVGLIADGALASSGDGAPHPLP